LITKELLETYYKDFAQKQGWETVISEDFNPYFKGDRESLLPFSQKISE
jgi:hypothetical protein